VKKNQAPLAPPSGPNAICRNTTNQSQKGGAVEGGL